MTFYTPQEITGMIERSASPDAGSPEVGLLLATQANAAATLFLAETLENLLIEFQVRGNR